MVSSYIIGSIVQFKKPASADFDESGSGELVGIVVTANKVIYLVLDHADGIIKEKGCGDFRITGSGDGKITFSHYRCF